MKENMSFVIFFWRIRCSRWRWWWTPI